MSHASCMPPSRLVLRRLAAVTRLAQPAPVLRVVGVEAAVDELAPAEGVVVGVDGGRLATEDADPVSCEHGRPERLLVLTSVPALSCAAALGLGLLPTAWTPAPLIAVLRASRY